MQIDAALVSEKGEAYDIKRPDIQDPQSGELLIEIKGVGLCHTDLLVRDQFISMKLPAVLGHEGAGIVKVIGPDVVDINVGDQVVCRFQAVAIVAAVTRIYRAIAGRLWR